MGAGASAATPRTSAGTWALSEVVAGICASNPGNRCANCLNTEATKTWIATLDAEQRGVEQARAAALRAFERRTPSCVGG